MTKTIGIGVALSMLTCLANVLRAAPPAQSRLRPPAVPLVTCDPYFSVWSMNDRLTDGPTRHWTGKSQPLTSLVRIDGQTFRIMGDEPKDLPAAKQVGLTILPTRTIYDFDAAGVRVPLTFMTPLLPDDLMLCARPITYINWEVKATDGNSHEVSIYLDASALLAVNTPDQRVGKDYGFSKGRFNWVRVGTIDQPMLETRGDDVRIDWGFLYLAGNTRDVAIAPAPSTRTRFIQDG